MNDQQQGEKRALDVLEYAPARKGRRRFRLVIIACIAISAVAALALRIVSRSYICSYTPNYRLDCCRNLREIGLGIAFYANDHGGQFPDSLKTELEYEDIRPKAFVCPATTDLPPSGPTTRAIATDLLTPGHLSYIYLGSGLSNKSATSDTVLAYEPLGNHNGDGMNVLFGDFEVQWIPAVGAKDLLNQVARHIWPVRIPAATQPTTQGGGN